MGAIPLLLLMLGAVSLAEISPPTTAPTYIITTYRPKSIQKYYENLIASESSAPVPLSRLEAAPPNSIKSIDSRASEDPKTLEKGGFEENESSPSQTIQHRKPSEDDSSAQESSREPERQNPQENYSSASHTINRRQNLSFRPTPPKPNNSGPYQGSQSFRPTPSKPDNLGVYESRQSFRSPPSKPENSGAYQGSQSYRLTPPKPDNSGTYQGSQSFRPTPSKPDNLGAYQTVDSFRPTPSKPENLGAYQSGQSFRQTPLKPDNLGTYQGSQSFRPTPSEPDNLGAYQSGQSFRPTPSKPDDLGAYQGSQSFRPTPSKPDNHEAFQDSQSFRPTPSELDNVDDFQESESFRPTPSKPDNQGTFQGSQPPKRQTFSRIRQNPSPPVNTVQQQSKPEQDGVQASETSRHLISRRQDGPGRRRPGAPGPPGSAGPPKEEPDYDDPNADRSYNFRFDTPVYSRREQADPKGEVSGRYTYVDDAGVRRVVDYLAGGRTGFYVRGSYPDPEIPGLSLFQASYGPGGRGPARARTSVHRGVDGSYRFDYGGPEHRRRESADANGNVRGAYTYLDSAGRTRTVQYIAGPNIGFRVTQNTLGPPGPFVYPFPRPTIIPAAPTQRPRPGAGPPTLRPSASTFPANPQAVPRPPPETDFKDETLDNIPDLSSSGGGNFQQGAANPINPLDTNPFPSEEELPNPPQRGGDAGQATPDNNQGTYPGKEFDDVDPGDQSLPPPQPPTTVNDRPFRRGEEVPEVNSFEVEDFDKNINNDQDTGGQRGQGDFPNRDYDEPNNGERGGGGGGARPGPFRGRLVGSRSVGEGPFGRRRRIKGRRSHRPIRKDNHHHRDFRRDDNSIPDNPSSATNARSGPVPGIASVQSIDLNPVGSGAPAPSAALEARETFTARRSAPPLKVPSARRWTPSSRDTPA